MIAAILPALALLTGCAGAGDHGEAFVGTRLLRVPSPAVLFELDEFFYDELVQVEHSFPWRCVGTTDWSESLLIELRGTDFVRLPTTVDPDAWYGGECRVLELVRASGSDEPDVIELQVPGARIVDFVAHGDALVVLAAVVGGWLALEFEQESCIRSTTILTDVPCLPGAAAVGLDAGGRPWVFTRSHVAIVANADWSGGWQVTGREHWLGSYSTPTAIRAIDLDSVEAVFLGDDGVRLTAEYRIGAEGIRERELPAPVEPGSSDLAPREDWLLLYERDGEWFESEQRDVRFDGQDGFRRALSGSGWQRALAVGERDLFLLLSAGGIVGLGGTNELVDVVRRHGHLILVLEKGELIHVRMDRP
jgi:hypothetical protein